MHSKKDWKHCQRHNGPRNWLRDQAPAFWGISNRDGTGRDFAKSRDPGIFRDGINLFFSSRDWWDPGIFRDGISLIFLSRDFLEKLGSKTNKSLWNHGFVWYDKSLKIPGLYFPKSRDRDLSSIPGSRDPAGAWLAPSCWIHATPCHICKF